MLIEFSHSYKRRLALLSGGILFLSGCGTLSNKINAEGTSAKKIVWPSESDLNPLNSGGTYPAPETLTLLHPGLTKQQLKKIIGPPQFNEFIATREWNYLFNISTGKMGQYRICQYKVFFNKKSEVGSQYWLPENCGKTEQGSHLIVPVDGLFGYNQWQLSQLEKSSLQRLEGVADQLNKPAWRDKKITITAYTDRLGSDTYNKELSLKRATTISNFFIQHGVSSSRIKAQGAGNSHPVSKGCSDHLSQNLLVECLSPDRRVEIDFL
ncbi:OmpA family protein [Rosenbergiella epipactidis]|uniref:OmpA family protein n=1 Tax=Rosenbergiella epipactidis TaxID=1544694 RepID=UPI00202764B1|nr:OmpA family protein [Rosenbergiella epipactidis]MCL9668268.1 OmpA family protein [Rosenbergiella epipactidis]